MLNKLQRALVAMVTIAMIWAIATPAANAQVWDKKTTITVNQPFEVPGKVLPAGTYVLRLVDVAGVRNIVRFYSADEKKVYTTLIGIPDFKLDAPEKTDITFYESTPGTPRPLHAWFYPASQFGVEFAYPKKRATEIAKSEPEHVIALNVPPATTPEPETAPTVKELLEEPLIAIEPGGREVELAEVHPETPVEQAAVTEPTLPRTATPFPLVALIGLLAAGAATGMRFRK